MQIYLQKSSSYGRFLGILLLGHVSIVSALRNSYFTMFKRLFLCSLSELARRTYSFECSPDILGAP